MIGEIVTQIQLADLQREAAKNIRQRAYLAPAVHRDKKHPSTTSWKYYSSLDRAIKQHQFVTGAGGSSQTASGTINFTTQPTNQTFGHNVDFYYKFPVVGWLAVPYGVVREYWGKMSGQYVVIRFYKTNGTGPYYAVITPDRMGITATVANDIPARNVDALDDFHREVQILKSKFNTVAFYVQSLSKRQMNAAEAASYNRGVALLNRMAQDMKTIQGVVINFNGNSISGIGIIPVLAIAAILILSGAAAWTLDRINTERQKTARINVSYDHVQWIQQEKMTIAAAVQSGQISQSAANQMYSDLNTSAQDAQKVITASSQSSKGILDRVENIALIGLAIFAISKFVK